MARPLRTCAAAVAALALWLGALAGCGIKFELPTENRAGRGFSKDGSYTRLNTWTGMTGITDLLLTQGRGQQLFLVFRGSPGRVAEFATEAPVEIDRHRPLNMINPAAICSDGARLYVLDQGDTLMARANQPCRYEASCDSNLAGFTRPISDLSKYWRVREYQLYGGDTLSSFTDTTFAWVNGIAADDQGNVYVSGVVIICSVDRFDSRLKTIATEFRVRRYRRGGPDPDMPGARWERDRGYELIEGSGLGSTKDPRGMQWVGAGQGGPALFFADFGNSEAQKFPEPGAAASAFKFEIGGTGPDSLHLLLPTDVAVDGAGFAYIADTGNLRVLRYAPHPVLTFEYAQRVDLIKPGSIPLLNPVGVAADDSLVYVADAGRGEVVRYKRLP